MLQLLATHRRLDRTTWRSTFEIRHSVGPARGAERRADLVETGLHRLACDVALAPACDVFSITAPTRWMQAPGCWSHSRLHLDRVCCGSSSTTSESQRLRATARRRLFSCTAWPLRSPRLTEVVHLLDRSSPDFIRYTCPPDRLNDSGIVLRTSSVLADRFDVDTSSETVRKQHPRPCREQIRHHQDGSNPIPRTSRPRLRLVPALAECSRSDSGSAGAVRMPDAGDQAVVLRTVIGRIYDPSLTVL